MCSVVLERRGDAIRFHPTILNLAARYRFEPRPVALARGNEKGRVERLIRFARDSFFRARRFRDLDDLNDQADEWCRTRAAERPCPEDRQRTVAEVFAEERAHHAHGPLALERAIAAAPERDTPHLAAACDTSSTSTASKATGPRHCPWRCPTTRGFAPCTCVPTTSPTTTTSTTNRPPTTTMNTTKPSEPGTVRQRLRDLALYGLAAQDETLLSEPWVERVIDIEDREGKRRSLQRRLTNARISAFKPIADFDWAWPKRIDRPFIDDIFSLAFIHDAVNIVFVGPNGIGKTMLTKNLVHHAILNGFTARFTMASDMLHELASQGSDASLARRRRRFTQPQLLAIDEVGYLNYDNRYANLLFEVVIRRYLSRPVLITTNKPFSEWGDVFSSAACVVTLVDRLIHRSEIVQLDSQSYRLKEAKERSAKRTKARSRRTAKPRAS